MGVPGRGLREKARMYCVKKESMRMNSKRTRLALLVLAIILIGGVAPVVGGAACQCGPVETAGQLDRGLPDAVVPGDEFWVTVTFTSPDDRFHAIGFTDVAPPGWTVTVDVAWAEPEALMAHTPQPEEAVYIWEGPYDAGVRFTVQYKVKASVDAEPGTYVFSGAIEYFIEPHPEPSYEEEITGDMQVTVSQRP